MITIDPRLNEEIRRYPGSIHVQVAGEPAAAVMAAMRQARRIITGLDSGWQSAPGLNRSDTNSPKFVSGPTPARPGPVLYIDGGHMRIADLLTIPKVIQAQLEATGVTTATIGPAAADLLTGLEIVKTSLLLRLYPDPPSMHSVPTTPPSGWLEPLWAWLEAEAPNTHRFVGMASGAQFALDSSDVHNYLREVWAARPLNVAIVSGDSNALIAALALRLAFGTVTLAFGGPTLSEDDVDRVAASLEHVARMLAKDLALGLLQFDQLDSVGVSEPTRLWARARDAPAGNWVHTVCDEVLFDAYPYQVLHPNHIRRLGGPPPGARSLPAGRFDLSLGQPREWLQKSRSQHLQARGRQMLSRCLLSTPEVLSLISTRNQAN